MQHFTFQKTLGGKDDWTSNGYAYVKRSPSCVNQLYEHRNIYIRILNTLCRGENQNKY